MKISIITASVALALGSGAVFADSNMATSNQTGSGNTANISQTGSSGASADVLQQGSNNQAYVTQQSGSDAARASINQTGDNAGDTGTILQSNALGPDVVATIDQTGNITGGNSAAINQVDLTGISSATISQSNDSLDSSATINQTGDSQTASITQTTTGGTIGGSSASISQSGESHMADITQGPGEGPFGPLASRAEIIQSGSGNQSSVSQAWSDNSMVLVVQDGSNHLAQVNQGMEGRYNNVTVNQGGMDNEAYVDQVGAFGSADSPNSVVINQSGMGNVATAYQSGGGDYAGGTGNSATITQN